MLIGYACLIVSNNSELNKIETELKKCYEALILGKKTLDKKLKL